MIWRLMAFIVAMSDTGSVSMVTAHTDWPDEMSCRQILRSHYTPPPDTVFNGHNTTVKISASCVPVGNVPVGALPPQPQPYAPPLANVVPQFFNELGQRMLAPPCGGRVPCDYN
jgi:hypothetical protein